MAETKVSERKVGKLNIIQVAFLIGTLVEVYNKLIPDADREKREVEYVPAYPGWLLGKTGSADTTDVHHRVITWDVVRRDNGSRSERPFGATKEMRPQLREEVVQTRDDDTTYVREIYGKWYDNLLRFDCFAPTALEAHESLIRFERMLEVHAQFLEGMGVSKLTYYGRTSPIYLENARYHSKACLWYVRTEQIWYRDEERVKKVEFDVSSEMTSIMEKSLET